MIGCLEGAAGPFSVENWKAFQKVFSEFLATGIFVYCGLGSCLNWSHDSDPDQLIRIAFTFGIGLTALAYMFGPISGCHINPAVTAACVGAGRTKVGLGMLYVIAQCFGAIVGAGCLYLIQDEELIGNGNSNLFGLTKINPELSVHQGLFLEATGTTILCLAVLFITDKGRDEFKVFGPIGIGFTLVVLELALVNATGGSFNPVRSLGPACIVGDFAQLWVYWFGPIGGALVGVAIYKLITYEPKEQLEPKDPEIPTPSTATVQISNGTIPEGGDPVFFRNAESGTGSGTSFTINVEHPENPVPDSGLSSLELIEF